MEPPNGAFQCGSDGRAIRFEDITDGLSNTLFAGEKHVTLHKFGVGWLDCSLYNGDYPSCSCRSGGPDYPLATSPLEERALFGSYHPGICQFGFGDGSVRSLPNNIDPKVLGLLTDINDGQVIPNWD